MDKTIEVLSIDRCTGCKVCGDVCPKNAIEFYNANDGFWYPKINYDNCIKCELCYKKCPSINDRNEINNCVLKCYGAKSKVEKIRYDSTSGGFFTELAEKWIKNGGVVIGAEYNESNLVHHVSAINKKDIEKLRQSKYVQSDTKGIYKITKDLLNKNKKVLFCGTPCQVEALLMFLGNNYENLLTLDFVCCGICSPGIYKKYLEEIEHKYKSKIKKVWFKNKEEGWRNIGIRIDLENGKHYFKIGTRDLFMTSFVTDALSMRLSCERCKYRKLPHNSDIMLGDFWGIEDVNPLFDDNRGVSAILINSYKGIDAFKSVMDRLDYFITTKEEIAKGNFTIYESKQTNPLRDKFIELMNTKGFKKSMQKFGSYKGINKIKIDVRYYLWKLNNR